MNGKLLVLKVGLLFIVILVVFAVVFVSLDQKSILTRFLPEKKDSKVTSAVPPATNTNQKEEAAVQPQDETSLTLNLRGRSGCLVCHSDRNAVGRIDGEIRSIYVDDTLFTDSPHKDLTCLSCHLDFSYTHPTEVVNYKKVAGLSCSRCHDHKKEAEDYRASVHGRLALSEDPEEGATCGDCHGAHDIKSLKKSKEYKLKFRSSAKEVCGQCHMDRYTTYNDYYHGRAYKRGAHDAPPCWDCHDYHNVLPASEAASSISATNLAKTCGGCHRGSTKKFTEYALLVHSRKKIEETNPVLRYKNLVLGWLGRTTEPYSKTSGSLYTSYVKPYLDKIRSWFFPESLRPKK